MRPCTLELVCLVDLGCFPWVSLSDSKLNYNIVYCNCPHAKAMYIIE